MKTVHLDNGIELQVRDEGPRDAPALIFLHGFPESHRTWRHQIPHLSRRFRCIAPDQRGYRHSSKPGGPEHYRAHLLVGDVFALADALDIAQFTVVGHDWGGAIAWAVAMAGQPTKEQGAAGPHAGRVTRAIIANAPHPAVMQPLLYTDREQRAASQYIRVFRDTDNDALIRQGGLLPLLAKAFPNREAAPRPDAEEQAALIEDWSDPERAFGMINWYRASAIDVPPMDAPFAIPDDATAISTPRITIPTLVVWGMEDHAIRPANLDQLPDHVDDLTIERIGDAGHFVIWERPEAVNAAMDRFLGTGER
ncbi:alpha/beta fold hydrolase [Croceicoccus hydrothermalis]|uniref:alpha/beta fold hydrolase n=1 Tax=Croceicoccus hydrothermalis TaxID=2867964 RepID=UPI001EFBC4AA|nr:alpha/beta hydrolase [Croceicoccus hydrothermalis]